jgi:hypothetical protein
MMEELERDGYHLVEWGNEPLIHLLKRSGIETVILKISKCEASCQSIKINFIPNIVEKMLTHFGHIHFLRMNSGNFFFREFECTRDLI